MRLCVTEFASVPYFVVIYFCHLLLRDTSCFVRQTNVLTLELAYSFPIVKFDDRAKNKIISLKEQNE